MTSDFFKLDIEITGSAGLCFQAQKKAFKNHFGVNPRVCACIHKRIKIQFSVSVGKIFMLWSLYFLCCYPKVKTIRKLFGVDVKTFRKHTSEIIWHMKKLKVVSYNYMSCEY